jgi:hypothetical protein
VSVAAAFISSLTVGALAFGGGGCFLVEVITRGDALRSVVPIELKWTAGEVDAEAAGLLDGDNKILDSVLFVRLVARGESKEEYREGCASFPLIVA